MEVDRLDHLVLTVRDIDRTVKFYQTVLGMQEVRFGQGRVSLLYGKQKINLHQQGKELKPKAHNPMPGSADLCFIINNPIEQAMEHVKAQGVEIIEGPVKRTGALGPITSFYFRDPDKNLIEVSN